MFQTYQDAVKYVEGKKEAGIVYDIERMKLLMKHLRHPERRVKTIHVAGTNGKGSTVTFLQNMLQESSFFVGTFMTPAFGDPKNQISINGEPMSETDFLNGINAIYDKVVQVEEKANQPFSFFEVMTTLALYFFSTQKPVDMAIIETGMGGRKDATNVITPLVSIITNISFDHEAYLGESIEDIAAEKAGIIKSGVPVMTAAQSPALDILKREAANKKSTVYSLHERIKLDSRIVEGKQLLDYEAPYRTMKDIELGMFGDHQGENAALCLMTLDYLKQFYAVIVDDEQIKQGLKQAAIRGRFEQVNESPVIILDTAHNPAAVKVSVTALIQKYPNHTIHVLFGAMEDKNVVEMLTILDRAAIKLNVTTFDSERAKKLDTYETLNNDHMPLNNVKDLRHFLLEWKNKSSADEVLFVVGSHHFIGEVINRTDL
ncbi:bifunctional folylpolyglutamate synthase/dihydrofolate synthase [Evansella halocellulosilytica]|uniref:bifunctional folylpolyglutamate synthase/dihydrofolate synthase n=1 Tax=Evansella halocellulosilytica TaxID=2011013 RepID=UPI000BB6BAB9|nr:folylpolyglutamate synthase/dihydrofolate synthase family protein [Evansella halocellulosilytica]